MVSLASLGVTRRPKVKQAMALALPKDFFAGRGTPFKTDGLGLRGHAFAIGQSLTDLPEEDDQPG